MGSISKSVSHQENWEITKTLLNPVTPSDTQHMAHYPTTSGNRFQMSFNRNEIEEFQNKEQDLMEVFKTQKRCDVYKKSVGLVHNLYVKKNLIGLWYETD